MKVSIISAFPSLYTEFLQTSLIGKAQQKRIVTITVDNLFSFVQSKERIDAPTFGPGAGMIIRPEVIERAIDSIEHKQGKAFKIFFSPHGKKLDQRLLKQLADQARKTKHVLLMPARYEGMDARIEQEYADEIISIGDFVIMGGDLPAMILLEGLLRFVPGVVGREESVVQDSFSGAFVDYPEYTAPVTWKGKTVPEIVRSGNHAAIQEWRTQRAAQRTMLHHFDWFRSCSATEQEKKLAQSYIPPHYAALMHTNVLVGPEGQEGTTSVTSLDIHDIARSAKTYGIKNYFVVTPLIDQQKIVRVLLDFWHTGIGVNYNKNRHDAVKQVALKSDLEQVIDAIERQEGVKPLLIATSAKVSKHFDMITYYDQDKVWSANRPILFLFGTGQGLSSALLQRCDYLMVPIMGLSDFNHLSVRSAAAIVFDRWFGLNQKTV